VNDCVAAITAAGSAAQAGDAGACAIVKNPETTAACSFLIPPAQAVDAGTDATTPADSATEGG
jgi:hypothetical protein